MNYKSIIQNRETRVKLMRLLSFIPDITMVRLQYRIKTGRKLDLKNPQRYTEKLQYYKLYYRDPVMARCADKYEVRGYIEEQGYGWMLNELIGVYDEPDQIDFAKLPQQFVLKDTLGGGGNGVILCKNKNDMDVPALYAKMAEWVKSPVGKNPGREWVYDNKRGRILIEKYIPSDAKKGGLIDYKFFCFNGKCSYVYTIADRKVGQKAGLGIATPDFKFLPYVRVDEKPLERIIQKPQNWEEMLAYAEDLSRPFPHARIDLYNVSGKIIFGEITFFDGSGYMTFEPDKFDYMLGNPFVLPERNHR